MRDKISRGNASQFFIAGELSRRGYSAAITMGNTPNTDILCSNIAGTRFVHIQVKTFVPGNRTCSVGMKAECDYGKNFFWILGGIPEPASPASFCYYIIPSSVMAKNVPKAHRRWKRTPGAKGQAHNESSIRTVLLPPFQSKNSWKIHKYLNRWDLIARKLDR